jgi:polyhydroxyalkanoate synthesis repressor PhaR
MPVIKRYPNRKLYDTDAKQYITLDGIASLIRDGEEVQVVDNVTGEDLTAVTLTQIIFEQEKKQSGFLPRSVLAGLIKTGGERLNAIQKTLISPMGLWPHVDEEIKRRIDTLINLGELTREEGQIILGKLLSDAFHQDQEGSNQATQLSVTPEALEKKLQQLQIPTQKDLEKLLKQIDTLGEKINDLTKT